MRVLIIMRQNLIVPESGYGLETTTVPGSLSGSGVLLMRLPRRL